MVACDHSIMTRLMILKPGQGYQIQGHTRASADHQLHDSQERQDRQHGRKPPFLGRGCEGGGGKYQQRYELQNQDEDDDAGTKQSSTLHGFGHSSPKITWLVL
jgi:hypothetical protein